MDDREFNIELHNLLNNEAAKKRFYVSVEEERTAVIDAFHDHYAALSVADEIDTVEDLMARIESTQKSRSPEEDEALHDEFIASLNECLQKDIEQHPLLLSGEMRVSGEGIYLPLPEPEDASDFIGEPEMLSDGTMIIGDIQFYSVESIVSYEQYKRITSNQDEDPIYEEIVETPGIMLYLENARVIEPDMQEERAVGDVVVPLTYASLVFEKVDHHAPEKKPQQSIEEPIDINEHFRSDFIRETCLNIENALNYNDYDIDEAQAEREYYQAELKVYMNAVDAQKPLSLSAFTARMLSGDYMELTEQKAYYLEAVLVKVGENWRVAHGFEIETKAGNNIAHVLIEDIVDVRYLSEE